MFSRIIAQFCLYLLYISYIQRIQPHCFHHKDCTTCTQRKTWSRGPCRWCPLDRACHAKWSPKNHCMREQNIQHHSQCTDYRYGEYDPSEAYKLAMFSAIAYSDEPDQCLQDLFPEDDYKVDTVIMRNCDDFVFNYDKQCLAFTAVSEDNKEIILAYRGSRGVKQILDQVLTIIGTPKVSSKIGGKVQSYFDNAKNKLYKNAKQAVVDLLNRYPDYDIKVTGHSLGGAVASISSALLVKEEIVKAGKMSLYTFGMPRVGNKLYAENHDSLVNNSWRVVQDGDIVPRFPVCTLASCSMFNGPYHHRNKVLYSDPSMTVDSKYVICKGNEDSKSTCESRRQKRFVKKMMNKHRNYFSIPIGTYCRDHVLKHRKISSRTEHLQESSDEDSVEE